MIAKHIHGAIADTFPEKVAATPKIVTNRLNIGWSVMRFHDPSAAV